MGLLAREWGTNLVCLKLRFLRMHLPTKETEFLDLVDTYGQGPLSENKRSPFKKLSPNIMILLGHFYFGDL